MVVVFGVGVITFVGKSFILSSSAVVVVVIDDNDGDNNGEPVSGYYTQKDYDEINSSVDNSDIEQVLNFKF